MIGSRQRSRNRVTSGTNLSERGTALILVLALAAIASLLGMSLLFTTDVDFKTSKNFLDRAAALDSSDTAINEVIWRMNLATEMAAMSDTKITVNSLYAYDAKIDYDPLGVLSNNLDDDNDTEFDEIDELNLTYQWTTRILQTTTEPNPGGNWEITDSSITAGPPWGSTFVEATIQPEGTWKIYSDSDINSDDILTVRFKLDTDTVLGDSEGDGPEIVFYDEQLATNTVEDVNTLSALGGDGDPTNDSPYNITWSDGTTTYPASGAPVFLVTLTGQSVNGGKTVSRRPVEIEIYHASGLKPVVDKAVCACGDLKLGGSVDSFKSSEGFYGTGTVYDNGDIGSNANIYLTGGGLVAGNAEATDQIKLSGTIGKDAWAGADIVTVAEVNGNSYEWESPAPDPCECDAFDLEDLMNGAAANNVNATGILPASDKAYSQGTCTIIKKSTFPDKKNPYNMNIPSNSSVIFTGGTYYLTALNVADELQVGIDTDGDCMVDAPPTEPVKIYVDGRIAGDGRVSLSSHGIVNGSNKPEDLQIYMYTVDKDFSASGAFVFRGFLYNPYTDCAVSGGAVIEGAMICNEFQGGGDGIHYDQDLGEVILFEEDDGIRLLAWREDP